MKPQGRIAAALARFTNSVMARVDRYALYPMQVVSQNGDGTLELKSLLPARVGGQSHVPILTDDPGTRIQVAAGSLVFFGWAGGQPTAPYAALWQTGASGGLRSRVVTASEKLSYVAPQVNVGGDPGSDAMLRGTAFVTEALQAFTTALTTFVTALQAFNTGMAATSSFSSPVPPGVNELASTFEAPIAAMLTAVAAFQTASAGTLSTISRTS